MFQDRYEIDDLIETINGICLRSNAVSIGSVSSPAISNSILYEFDMNINTYCLSKDLIYSRYADDIYISSAKYIDKSIIEYVQNELNKNGFNLNNKKTKFMSKKVHRSITGVTITDSNQISVGLEMRKQIKSMIYKKITRGEGDSNTILGYLSYLQNIEPQYYDKIIIKFSIYGDVISLIKQKNQKPLVNHEGEERLQTG